VRHKPKNRERRRVDHNGKRQYSKGQIVVRLNGDGTVRYIHR
jgi:hypothetical protein